MFFTVGGRQWRPLKYRINLKSFVSWCFFSEAVTAYDGYIKILLLFRDVHLHEVLSHISKEKFNDGICIFILFYNLRKTNSYILMVSSVHSQKTFLRGIVNVFNMWETKMAHCSALCHFLQKDSTWQLTEVCYLNYIFI